MLNKIRYITSKYTINNIIFLIILLLISVVSSRMLNAPIVPTYLLVIAVCTAHFLSVLFEFYIALKLLKINVLFMDIYKKLYIILIFKFLLSGIFRLVLNNSIYLYDIINNIIKIIVFAFMVYVMKIEYSLSRKKCIFFIMLYIVLDCLLLGLKILLKIFIHI